MRKVLHILTRPGDSLPREIIASQQIDGKSLLNMVDLTEPGADYKGLLERIFEADSVEVW